ncbi:MAG TPA: putative lipid II flippase FtsW [Acidimicrobiia bacterium]|nr:putative lipid II flippase FtsW [Acidimicrobiaceae bacterium]HIM66304.1 putative lipid II flippase FtsW [Acidimicrobiia bacterium]
MSVTKARGTARARSRDPADGGRKGPTRPSGRRSTRFLMLGSMAMLLGMLGVVMVLSSSSVTDLRLYDDAWYHLKKQVIWFAIGLMALTTTMRIDYRRLRLIAQPAIILAVGLLVLVLIPGVGLRVNGATRWLGFGSVTFQPSEVAKLAMLLYSADLLSRHGRPSNDLRLTLRPVLLMTVTIGALLMGEPDLGTVVILCAIVGSLLFFAGIRLRVLGLVGLTGLAGLAALSLSADYRRQRLLSMLDPWTDPLNTGWQTIQAGVAVSNGGIGGIGLGASRAKWGFLPYAHTDFIYAIVAEEWGLVGAGLVILAYLVIGLVGLSTALRAPDPFGQLLAAGVTCWVVVQAFVNIGAVLGVLPITGVPLPFVSFGGSALVVTMAAFGVLLNIARQTR